MLSRYRWLLAYTWPVRVALGIVFLYSSVPKLGDLAGVVQNVQAYNVLPEPLATIYGYALPFGELTLGLLLAIGLFTRLAAAGGAALMLSFLIAIVINLVRGDAPACGCFDVEGDAPLDWTALVRDVVLLAATAPPFFDPERYVSLDRWLFGAPASETEAVDTAPPDTGAGHSEPGGS